jgi:hypothetical protein
LITCPEVQIFLANGAASTKERWRDQLLEGVTGIFGEDGKAEGLFDPRV